MASRDGISPSRYDPDPAVLAGIDTGVDKAFSAATPGRCISVDEDAIREIGSRSLGETSSGEAIRCVEETRSPWRAAADR